MTKGESDQALRDMQNILLNFLGGLYAANTCGYVQDDMLKLVRKFSDDYRNLMAKEVP